MKKNKENCPNEAVAVFPWGGNLINCCEVHLKGLRALDNAIGGGATPRFIFSGKYQCEMPNDLEEYKAAEQEVFDSNVQTKENK